MNWQTAVRQKIFDSRAEEELKAFLRKALPVFRAPRDARAWMRRAAVLRRRALSEVYLRGYPREVVQAAPRVVWGEVLEPDPAYRIRKLRYEVYPGYWIPALLYDPFAGQGRVPVVLNTMGHGLTGKADAHMQIRCANLARRGMPALNIEFVGMGELTADVYHGRQGYLNLTGRAGTGIMVLALKKGLDVLLAHPRADRRRVAVTGLSGGGWQSIVIGALDRRVTLCAPVAGYTSLRARLEVPADVGDLEQVPVDLAAVLDYQDLTAMVAPRPLLQIMNADDDCCFATERVKPVIVDAIRPVYRAFGVEDRLAYHDNHDPGTHNYDADNRSRFYRFLNRHFELEAPEQDIHRPEDILPAYRLRVGLPAEQESFLTIARKRAYALCADRKPAANARDRTRLRKRLSAVLRLPEYRVRDRVVCRRGQQHQHLLRMGPWSVPMTAFTPREGAAGTELRFADAGRAHFETAPEGDRNVYAADLFDTGENACTMGRKLLVEAAGHRLLGIQVAQVLALAGWAVRRGGGKRVDVSVHGFTMTTAALMAAALFPELFRQLRLSNIPGTLISLIDWAERYEQRQSLFCFGLLEVCDLPDLVPLLEDVALVTDR